MKKLCSNSMVLIAKDKKTLKKATLCLKVNKNLIENDNKMRFVNVSKIAKIDNEWLSYYNYDSENCSKEDILKTFLNNKGFDIDIKTVSVIFDEKIATNTDETRKYLPYNYWIDTNIKEIENIGTLYNFQDALLDSINSVLKVRFNSISEINKHFENSNDKYLYVRKLGNVEVD